MRDSGHDDRRSPSRQSRPQERQHESQRRDNYSNSRQSKSWYDHQREMESMRDNSRNEGSQNYDPRAPRYSGPFLQDSFLA